MFLKRYRSLLYAQIFYRAAEILDEGVPFACTTIYRAADQLGCSWAQTTAAIDVFAGYFKPSPHARVWWGDILVPENQEARALALLLTAEMLRNP